jgi:hypothetical protein
MKIIKTIRTHSESINSLLICKNGNLISASLGRIIFYSKKNLEVILRITEFKHFYISHINELHKDNTFIFCHNGFIIFETSEDNKTYKVLYSFYERFLFHKSIEFDYKCEINSNIKYNIIISSIYGIHIFENKKINDENKYIFTKADYYSDKYNIKNPNNNTKKQNLIIDKSQECEIMYIPKAKSEVKNKKKLNNEKHKKLKYLIGQKENIPFNIKTKSLNIKENKFNCENRRNPNLFLYDNLSYTKNKYREENNKTMNQAFLNKKLEFLSELNSPVNKCKINSKKKTNNFNLYNRYTKQLKKDKFNFNRYLTNKTISLMNRFGNSQNNKCIMPPNNLKNILFKEEAKYFDFY